MWGVTGKTGRALTAALIARGVRVEGISRRDDAPDGVTRIWRPDELPTALDGADLAWLIAPNMYADEVELARSFVAAASRGGVTRLGYHSVLNPDDTAMAHHLRKHAAEKLLRDGHDDVVIVRPSAYHQNLSTAALTGQIAVPYRVDAPFRTVDLLDVGGAAAALSLLPDPAQRVVELIGPEELTVADMARHATEVLHRRVDAKRVPVSADAPIDLAAMFHAYDRDGFLPHSGANSSSLCDLLGRPATTWKTHLTTLDRSRS